MRNSVSHQDIMWIDIESPKREDIEYLAKNFNFHEVVLDELTEPGHRPKVGRYSDYLFLILSYPALDKGKRILFPRELEILVTKTHVITAHIGTIPPLRAFFQELTDRPEKRNEYIDGSTANLLFHLMHNVLENVLGKIDRIENRLTYIEKEIFRGEQRKMVFEISDAKRDIIDFRRILAPQTTILESLVTEGENFFGKEFVPHFRDLHGTFGIIWNEIQNQRETIQALGETNESLRAAKTSEIIQVLTVFSVIFLPLSLIVNIWGMNVRVPLSAHSMGFWFILGLVGVAVTLMIVYFKRKKWM
jgi:magnesium transporter